MSLIGRMKRKFGKQESVDFTPFFYKYCPDCGKNLHSDYAKIAYIKRRGGSIKFKKGLCLSCSGTPETNDLERLIREEKREKQNENNRIINA